MTRDQTELLRLAHAYAVAVDRRDLAALRALFLPGGTVTSRIGDRVERYAGDDGLADLLAAVARFDLTVHDVGTQRVALDGEDRARGEVLCAAHHVGAGTDDLLHLRYDDDYRRDADGRWRIAARELRAVAQERRAVTVA
jgi:hypothetical protein